MNVSHYGVHWAPGGIAFLLQRQRGAQNLISPDLACPFSYKSRGWLTCPHEIDLSSPSPLPQWTQDPLAQAFLPVPGRAKKMILDPDRKLGPLLVKLSRLSSPTEPFLRPIWSQERHGMEQFYRLSNIMPMAFIGAEAIHARQVLHHMDLAELYNRRVLIVARERLPVFEGEWITTDLTVLGDEPFEQIGAAALRECMNEPPR